MLLNVKSEGNSNGNDRIFKTGSGGQISKPQPHANIIHSKSTLYLQK
jgi:hypothetical protein